MVVAITVFFQTAVFGMVLCIHSDGTQWVEDFAELAACHASRQVSERHGAGHTLAASNSCTDRVLTIEAVASRTDSQDSMRLALSPPLVALLPWAFLFQATEVTQQFAASNSPAFPFDQHARILSSTVIVI